MCSTQWTSALAAAERGGVWVAYRAAFAGAYDVWPFSSELHALRTAVRWADGAVVFVPFGHVMSDVIAAAAAGTA